MNGFPMIYDTAIHNEHSFGQMDTFEIQTQLNWTTEDEN